MLKRLLAKASPLLGSHADWQGSCLLCNQPCDNEPLLCSWCRQALHQSEPRCRLCAAPLADYIKENIPVCGRCQRRPPPWERLQVIGDYQTPYPMLIPRLNIPARSCWRRYWHASWPIIWIAASRRRRSFRFPCTGGGSGGVGSIRRGRSHKPLASSPVFPATTLYCNASRRPRNKQP